MREAKFATKTTPTPLGAYLSKSRLFGNRWLPQTTCADCARCSGDLPPPSPPAEKATACQNQAGQSRTGDGAGDNKLASDLTTARVSYGVDIKVGHSDHLHQKGSQKRSLGSHGRLMPAGLARPPTPVSRNRLSCGEVTASCLPPSLKIRTVIAHKRTVLPSMPPSLMLPGPKLLKTVIVEACVTLLDAHESSAATRSSFRCILHFPPRSASILVIP